MNKYIVRYRKYDVEKDRYLEKRKTVEAHHMAVDDRHGILMFYNDMGESIRMFNTNGWCAARLAK